MRREGSTPNQTPLRQRPAKMWRPSKSWPSAVVLTTPWDRDVAALLEGWLLGQAGGSATADVLFGRVNPAGNLELLTRQLRTPEEVPDGQR